MDKIKCPACGTEVLAGTENCPTCGAPVGAISEDNISGVPIDNHAAIDTMLRSASRLVEQSEALGVGLEGEEKKPDGEGGENFQRSDVNSLPSELSDNQKNAMAGGVVNLTPGTPPLNQGAPNKSSPAAPASQATAADPAIAASGLGVPGSGVPAAENAPGITLFEMDDNGNAVGAESKDKKTKKEKPKKPKSSPAVIAAAVIISLAVGAVGGFFAKKFLFSDFPSPACQSFAEKAVSSVDKALPNGKKLYIAEAYVRELTASRQCIFRAFSGEGEEAKSEWYRVKIENDDAQKIHVFLQLSTEEYERLINSEDSEERIRASILMNIQSETDRCVQEAKNGEWEAANVTLLNNMLNPYVPSEEKPKQSSESSAAK